MKIPKIQKNILKMYFNSKDTRISIIGPTIHFDWVFILILSIALMIFLFWFSFGFYNDVEDKIKGDDFVPRSKTIDEKQLNKVIREIDFKNNASVNVLPQEVEDQDSNLESEESVDLIDDNG